VRTAAALYLMAQTGEESSKRDRAWAILPRETENATAQTRELAVIRR
jgi:hypothetical protein